MARARERDFVARTIAGVANALERAIFSEEQARLPGLLQRADPRAKLVATLALLLVAGLARNAAPLLVLWAIALLLARLSGLPLVDFTKRVWLGIPVFAGIVVLPSLVMIPGRPLLILLDAPPLWLAVTDNSLSGALLFVVRVGTSLSLALLLVSTTRWTDLLRGLRVLRVPDTFLVVLGMTYRYLFLFLRATGNLLLARASRTVGTTVAAEQRRWAAVAAGVLIGRSLKLSGDVLLAMGARGFAGEIRTVSDPKMRDEDWLLLALAAALAGTLLLF